MRRLSLLVVVLAGCASAPVPSRRQGGGSWARLPTQNELQFQTDDSLNRATVTDSAARGPFLDLKRADGKLQGTVRIDPAGGSGGEGQPDQRARRW